MKRLMSLILSVCFIQAAPAQQSAEKPEPHPSIQENADRYCGQWVVTGRTEETVIEHAREWTNSVTARPILDGFAVAVSHFFGPETSSEPDLEEVVWYDPVRQKLAFLSVHDNGLVLSGIGTVGSTSRWDGTLAKPGMSCRISVADTHAGDGKSFVRKAKISTDGSTWEPLFEAMFTKVGEAATRNGSDEQELLNVDRQYWQALVDGDLEAVERGLSDGFIGTYDEEGDGGDPVWTKEHFLAMLKSGTLVIRSWHYDTVKVRMRGNAAAITGLVTVGETFQGQDVSGQHRFTSTWLQTPSGWKCTGENYVRVSDQVGSESGDRELIRLQQEWSRAEVAGDVVALDRMLADEYVLTLSNGTPVPKAEYLRNVRSKDTRPTAMSIERTEVRLYEDTALVKGIVKWTEPSGTKHENLFNETWLQRDGHWQCLATHESRVTEKPAQSRGNEAVLQRVFDDVFNGGKVHAIDEIYHKDFVSHHFGYPDATGVEAHKRMVAGIRGAIPDYHEHLHEMVVEGDLAACHWTSTGTFKDSGVTVNSPCLSLYRFQDGKIIEQWLAFGGRPQEDVNKALVRRVMTDMKAADWDAVRELHSPDFVYHWSDDPNTLTRDEVGEMVRELGSAVPDLRRTIADVVAEEDKVAFRLTFAGTHLGEFQGRPPTGKKVEFQSTGIVRIVDGKIAEAWEDGDNLRFLQQFGPCELIGTQSPVDIDRLTPEMKKLEAMVGTWTFEGERFDPQIEGIPLPPVEKYKGTATNRFVLDGAFLEAHCEVRGAGLVMPFRILTGYDAEADHYVESLFGGDGFMDASVLTLSADGRVWTSRSTMTTTNGKEVLARGVTRFSTDGTTNDYVLELSDDGGKTWKVWLKDKGTKVKP